MSEQLTRTRRTKHATKTRPLGAQDCIAERIRGWETVRRLSELVQLSEPKPKWRVLFFPDASVCLWAFCVTQVFAMEQDSCVSVKRMKLERFEACYCCILRLPAELATCGRGGLC